MINLYKELRGFTTVEFAGNFGLKDSPTRFRAARPRARETRAPQTSIQGFVVQASRLHKLTLTG